MKFQPHIFDLLPFALSKRLYSLSAFTQTEHMLNKKIAKKLLFSLIGNWSESGLA